MLHCLDSPRQQLCEFRPSFLNVISLGSTKFVLPPSQAHTASRYGAPLHILFCTLTIPAYIHGPFSPTDDPDISESRFSHLCTVHVDT